MIAEELFVSVQAFTPDRVHVRCVELEISSAAVRTTQVLVVVLH
jgi:hypothetical protein